MVKNLIKHLQVPNRFILNIGINPAVLLSELIDKERYLTNEWKLEENNYFFHEYKYIYKNTWLLKSKFNTAKNKLIDLWLIDIKYWEWKRLLYKINNEKLLDIFFPKSKYELNNEDFLELLLDDGYIFYPAVLAHKFWINETIFIKSLVSKRKSFLNKNQLKSWYFFNSVSNIKNDTTLSRDQQLKCIKNLVELNLLDVKYDYDNTRYFCINIDLLSKFESLELNDIIKPEVRFNDKVESWITDKRHIELTNPFINNESWNTDDYQVLKTDNTEDIKPDDIEILNNDDIKSEISISWNGDLIWVENIKPYINNNKKENKKIKQKNNNKSLLLDIFNNELFVDKLLLTYDETVIVKVLNEAKYRNLDNKAWFVRWALENNIDFINNKGTLNELRENKKVEERKKEQEYSIQRDKLLEDKKLYLDWKNLNKEKYNEIYEKFKDEMVEQNLSSIRLNIEVEIKTKKYIIENYLITNN